MYTALEWCVETVHLYTMLEVRHFPLKGQDAGLLQLHSRVVPLVVVVLSLSELDAAMVCAKLGVVE